MAYNSSYRGLNQKGRSSRSSSFFTWIVVFVFIIIFAVSVFWFRTSKKQPETDSDSIAHILTPVSVDPSVVSGAVNLESSQATLINVASQKPSGTAVRGMVSNMFHITMSAALPEIDREKYFYEAWLVRQVPYTYISVGPFVTNDLGVFVLDWNGESGTLSHSEDLRAYTHIVITLQTKDGDTDPQSHIIEGDFGK